MIYCIKHSKLLGYCSMHWIVHWSYNHNEYPKLIQTVGIPNSRSSISRIWQAALLLESDSISYASQKWLKQLNFPKVTQAAIPIVTQKLYTPIVTQAAEFPRCDSTNCISWMWLNKLYLKQLYFPKVTQAAIQKVTQHVVHPNSDLTSRIVWSRTRFPV